MSDFTILTVCTGNICRSPLAELLLRQAFQNLPVLVHSAGTQALEGRGMPDPQRAIAASLGISNSASHRAQVLTSAHVQGADLILAMGREHRSAAVQLSPKDLRRVFTIRELARIVPSVPDTELSIQRSAEIAAKLRCAIEVAATNRGLALPPERPEDGDVVDPYRRDVDTYEKSRDQLLHALNSLLDYFRRVIEL